MIKIDKELCKKCSLCVKTCVRRVFKMVDGEVEVKPDNNCMECGQCVAVCPAGAISDDGWAMEDFTAMPELEIDGDAIVNFIKAKRSVRNFIDKPVPKDVIEKIIDAGRFAPSDKNTQRRGYVVVTDPKIIDQMDKAVVNSFRKLLKIVSTPVRKVLGAALPVVKELDASVPGIKKLIAASDKGAHPVFHNAPCVIFTYGPSASPLARDTAVATQHYMMLAAQALGVSSCIIGYASTRPDAMKGFFDLPEGNSLQTATIFGYSTTKYGKLVARNKPEITWVE